jgi:hypothetical protein
MHLEIKYLIILFSVVLIFGGLYFKFMYDVPDGEEVTNMWVSWFLILFGIIGILASTMWKKRDPLKIVDPDDDEEHVNLDVQNFRASHMQPKNKNDEIGKIESHDAGEVKK